MALIAQVPGLVAVRTAVPGSEPERVTADARRAVFRSGAAAGRPGALALLSEPVAEQAAGPLPKERARRREERPRAAAGAEALPMAMRRVPDPAVTALLAAAGAPVGADRESALGFAAAEGRPGPARGALELGWGAAVGQRELLRREAVRPARQLVGPHPGAGAARPGYRPERGGADGEHRLPAADAAFRHREHRGHRRALEGRAAAGLHRPFPVGPARRARAAASRRDRFGRE